MELGAQEDEESLINSENFSWDAKGLHKVRMGHKDTMPYQNKHINKTKKKKTHPRSISISD